MPSKETNLKQTKERGHVVANRTDEVQYHITEDDQLLAQSQRAVSHAPGGLNASNIIALQRTAGNRAVTRLITNTIQRLGQDLPYIGPLASYLNPRNQIIRALLPGLSDSQKALLDGIFCNSLATSIIRLNPNSALGFGDCYRTTGNIINMPGETIDDSHLIHEAANVWQSQNTIFGVGYAVSALRAMAIAQVIGGDWQRAYDYTQV